MGSFAGNTLIDTLSRRLRDTVNLGYSRTFVLDIINRTQRSINARFGLVLAEATFTTTNSSIYALSTIGTDVIRLVDMKENDRVLTRVPYQSLVYQDARWFRREGTQPEVFSQLGRDLFVVTPIAKSPRTLTATYVQQTTNLADAGTPLSALPDEYKDVWLDLAETILLFRGREFTELRKVLERTASALGLEDVLTAARRQGNTNNA